MSLSRLQGSHLPPEVLGIADSIYAQDPVELPEP
jgi:hypothetical protein